MWEQNNERFSTRKDNKLLSISVVCDTAFCSLSINLLNDITPCICNNNSTSWWHHFIRNSNYQNILRFVINIDMAFHLGFHLSSFHVTDYTSIEFFFSEWFFFLKRYIIQYLHFCSSFSCKRVECWYSIGLNEELLIDVYVSIRFYWTVQKWGSSDVYSQHQILNILPTPNLIIIIFYV